MPTTHSLLRRGHSIFRPTRNFFTSSPLTPRSPKPKIKSHIRFSSSSPTPKPASNPTNAEISTARTRLSTLLHRLPKFLHPYTLPLLRAPTTHIISFLILHEITAILPLFLLAGGFHYTGWLPSDWISGHDSIVGGGIKRFERYFSRKGWFGFGAEDSELVGDVTGDAGNSQVDQVQDAPCTHELVALTNKEGESNCNATGKRILLEVATAYAITKVLLPVRIGVCVWGTPWFARSVVGRFGGMFTKGKGVGKGGGGSV